MKALLALFTTLLIAGCASVESHNIDTVSIKYVAGTPEYEVQRLATARCKDAGKNSARRVLTTDSTAWMPSFLDNKVATFRCE